MKLDKKSIKAWVLYVGYAIIVTVALIYFLFPGDIIRKYVEQSVAGSGGGVVLTIDRIKPVFPIGLKFLGGQIFLKGKTDTSIFAVKRLSISPHIGTFLSGKAAFNFRALAYKGEITGSIRFRGYKVSGPCTFNAHLEDVMLEEIPSLATIAGRSLSGKLSGDITYDYGSGSFIQGRGESSLTISNGSAEFSLPFLHPGRIKFLSMETVAKLANGRLVLERCKLGGDGLRCDLSGTITLYKNIDDSIINIRGDMEPLSTSFENGNLTGAILALVGKQIQKKKIPFTVSGTIREPKVTFM